MQHVLVAIEYARWPMAKQPKECKPIEQLRMGLGLIWIALLL